MLKLLAAVVLTVAVVCLIFIPDWGENPEAWALGEWKEVARDMEGEVTEAGVAWHAYGRRGRLTYEWVQTDTEPYRIILRRGEHTEVPANVTFNGRDEAVLEPEVFDSLPDIARTFIRDNNRRRNRPDKEIRFIFKRVQPGSHR